MFAWVNFITRSGLNWLFPLPEAVAGFMFAGILFVLTGKRGLRVITVHSIRLIGFTIFLTWIIYSYTYRAEPFFSWRRLIGTFSQSRAPLEWLALFPVILFAVAFWIGGTALFKRPKSHLAVCSRFDIGLTAFFALLLSKLTLRVRCEATLAAPLSEPLILPFFIFGLLAVGLARGRGKGLNTISSVYNGGLLLGFIGGMLLLGAGFSLLFLPYLTTAAETGYILLKR
ncbi:hypothetical protein ACFLZM_07550, partial [Thermodesulfobacteriota bacterium]